MPVGAPDQERAIPPPAVAPLCKALREALAGEHLAALVQDGDRGARRRRCEQAFALAGGFAPARPEPRFPVSESGARSRLR